MFEIRKLGAKDISPLITIISKIGIKEFAKTFDDLNIKKDDKGDKDGIVDQVELKLTMNFVAVVAENLPKCMSDIFSFVASVTEKEVSEIEELGMDEFIELVVTIFQKEEFKKVFNLASQFIK